MLYQSELFKRFSQLVINLSFKPDMQFTYCSHQYASLYQFLQHCCHCTMQKLCYCCFGILDIVLLHIGLSDMCNNQKGIVIYLHNYIDYICCIICRHIVHHLVNQAIHNQATCTSEQIIQLPKMLPQPATKSVFNASHICI